MPDPVTPEQIAQIPDEHRLLIARWLAESADRHGRSWLDPSGIASSVLTGAAVDLAAPLLAEDSTLDHASMILAELFRGPAPYTDTDACAGNLPGGDPGDCCTADKPELPGPWAAMVPDPHPMANCGPLAMPLPPGVACPTCGTVPPVTVHHACRGSDVEAWIKRRRDEYTRDGGDPAPDWGWHALDDLLDDYREHADTGTPLGEDVPGPHPEEQ